MKRRSLDEQPIQVGVVAPLTSPGWEGAGRHLIAGVELAVREINLQRKLRNRIKLLVEDTAADPEKALAAVENLARQGAAAIVGEYHSVVARAIAKRAHELKLPFVCASAVLDTLTDGPTDWVARLAPPQSRSWAQYADFLAALNHRGIAVGYIPSIYWNTGRGILRDRLKKLNIDLVEIDVSSVSPVDLCRRLAPTSATALILLVGAPEPFISIVRHVREEPRLAGMLIGAPAGQCELDEVHSVLGHQGAGIPFLQYLPSRLSAAGRTTLERLERMLGQTPSFVALEGYDATKVVISLLEMKATGIAMDVIWRSMNIEGSRGHIRFSRVSGIDVWQWIEAPIQIADRDPANPDSIRIRRSQLRSAP
ncbi:amino acid ABC transporter substrate-binding protein [Pseudorhodoferax aquiterrae]|uniref:Amino acid ABC transporter substrate-binding protein n=1 Tax=Pseudorhodoferax aquiterrae TaxID=747304 RepID=A0ABQ3GH64_9BURK|nr:ABC transporter substrate-binding protein [Pseudorhodoferax aquiterrae]GHD04899.1 amino acid ABC transporter substrate-binding protein [Pseudorhodoferax aquiterrae]